MTEGLSPPNLKRKLGKILWVETTTEATLRTKRQKVAGFVNPRYRCFINAAVQCLASLPEIRDFSLSSMGTESPGSWSGNLSPSEAVSTPSLEGRRSKRTETAHAMKLRQALELVDLDNMDVTYEFVNLVNDVYHDPISPTTPVTKQGREKAKEREDAKKIPAIDGVGFATVFGRIFDGFDGETQQDSMEFVTQLLTRMHEEEVTLGKKPFIESAFEGKMRHKMHCDHCDGSWDNEESFRDIGVNFPLEAALKSPVKPTRRNPAVHVPLDTCLDNAFQKQTMDAGTKCRLCEKTGGVTDTPSLTSLPSNLITQIKRFSTEWVEKKTRKGTTMESVNRKINTVLNYGETLNLRKYCTTADGEPGVEDQTYELTGMVVHQG